MWATVGVWIGEIRHQTMDGKWKPIAGLFIGKLKSSRVAAERSPGYVHICFVRSWEIVGGLGVIPGNME